MPIKRQQHKKVNFFEEGLPTRCDWCGTDPLYVAYHDTEWGVPVHDDKAVFAHLLLETFQAGLSWLTVLRKRPAFSSAFSDFNVADIARFDARIVNELIQNKGIIRNRAKIQAAVHNARCVLNMQEKGEGLSDFFWQFVEGTPLQNNPKKMADIPAKTPLSEAISKELKHRGFKFIGPTTIYAHMQATGLVNDHIISCYRHKELSG